MSCSCYSWDSWFGGYAGPPQIVRKIKGRGRPKRTPARSMSPYPAGRCSARPATSEANAACAAVDWRSYSSISTK